MRFVRSGMGSPAALLLLVLTGGTALAAPTTNDTIAGATPAMIGFGEDIDTSEATTDVDDAQLNAGCGAPATDASVWYVVQGTGQGMVVDVSQSRYSAGVLVGVGTPGNLQIVTCGKGDVAFTAAAGTTYYVLVIDDQDDGAGNGGPLSISFAEIPPPPTLDITVDPFGTVDIKSGIATISGTYTCRNGNSFSASIDASQDVGRFKISGSGYFNYFGTCDGASHPWFANVVPQNGKFAGGKSLTMTFGYACGAAECSLGYVEQTIQLRGGPQ